MSLNIIPNLQNACAILRLLACHDGGLSQSRLQEELSLPRATTFRILTTLKLEGMVRKEGKLYFFGHAMAQFGIKCMSEMPLQEIAKSELKTLAHLIGETAHLAVPSGHQSLILGVHDSPNPIRVASRAGSLADMHCSSTGKIFLANMKEEELMHFLSSKTLNARTSKTITEKDALMMELSQVQAQGYAFDNEEYFEDVRCLAVPIHNRAAEVIGAIGITATSNRFSQDRNEEILNLIKNSAGNIEHKLLT